MSKLIFDEELRNECVTIEWWHEDDSFAILNGFKESYEVSCEGSLLTAFYSLSTSLLGVGIDATACIFRFNYCDKYGEYLRSDIYTFDEIMEG